MNRVFISYSRQDRVFIEQLADDLWIAGLQIEMVSDVPTPGRMWQPMVYQGLDEADLLLLCLSSELRPSVHLERRLRYAHEQGIQIVVIWQNAMPAHALEDGLLSQLSSYPHIRFYRSPQAYLAALQRLLRVIGEWRLQVLRQHSRTPFKGLSPYQEIDASLYFGQKANLRQALQHLQHYTFLVLLGSSGSGKSSLVRAGLLPKLRSGAIAGSQTWAIVVFSPRLHPIERLARRISALLPEQASLDVGAIREALRDIQGTNTVLKHLFHHYPHLVLVIDQFEDVFIVPNENERAAFLEIIGRLAKLSDGRIQFVVTMNAEFFSELRQYPDLADLFSDDHLLMMQTMPPAELQEAFESSAHLANLQIAPALIERIIDEVGSDLDVLSTLQYALFRLSMERSGNQLTQADYERLGKANQLLERDAEAAYHKLNATQQDIFRQVMLNIAELSENGDVTRRWMGIKEICGILGVTEVALYAVLEPFIHPSRRLLTIAMDRTGKQDELTVSHELLFIRWQRLQEWLLTTRDTLRDQAALRKAADNWAAHEHDVAFLLRGKRLAQAERWLYDRALNSLEKRFIQASVTNQIALQQREASQEYRIHRVQRRMNRRLRILLFLLILAALLLLIFVSDQSSGWLLSNWPNWYIMVI